MFVFGKTVDQEAASQELGRYPNGAVYAGFRDCTWIAWDGETPDAMKSFDVRMMLLYTLEKELKLWKRPMGSTYRFPDDVIFALVDSITGEGRLWWEEYGHEYVRQAAVNLRGFA